MPVNSTNQLETLPGPTGYHTAVESTQGPKTTDLKTFLQLSLPGIQNFMGKQRYPTHSSKKDVREGNYLLHLDRKTPTEEGAGHENPPNRSRKPRLI